MGYFDDTIDNIIKSLNSVDNEQLDNLIESCCRVLRDGNKIIASGLGKNVPICEKFVGTLNSLGLDARFLHTNTAVHGDLGMINRGDLVILLSKSGKTTETVALHEHISKREVEEWLMCFDKDCDLAKKVPNSLSMTLEDEGDLWNIVPNNSTTIYLIVLQTVAIEVAKRLNITLDDFKRNHPGGGIGIALGK